MKEMKRRDFLKYAAGGMSALAIGGNMPWLFESQAFAQVQVAPSIEFTITDCLKDMATNNDINAAKCYYWCYVDSRPASATVTPLPPDCPGPTIFATQGQTIPVKITNALDEPHAFFIPNHFSTGPIAPGATFTGSFVAKKAGTYLYYDNLNAPVNRVMGLHGACVIMPNKVSTKLNNVTPYSVPTPAIQQLFNDFGKAPWWPGLAWDKGDPTTNTPAFRQYIWLLHQGSPNLFATVGDYTPGKNYPPAQFIQKFLQDRFNPAAPNRNNNVPQYFTISGQSGHFSHNNPYICPNNRVGEPVLIRLLNAGLWTHSMHIHANHVYVIGINGVPQANPLWVDVFTMNPMDCVDWMVPYMRPPDVPNINGFGRADTPMTSLNNLPVWPPNEEINYFIPNNLSAGAINLSVQLSPLCYPMHDHSEPSQSSQGGNYNMGMISGLNFTGDRNIAGGVATFPNAPLETCPSWVNGLEPPSKQW